MCRFYKDICFVLLENCYHFSLFSAPRDANKAKKSLVRVHYFAN